jgi:hypothetical protein
MPKTLYEQWQWWRGELAQARRAEAKAFAVVHRSFRGAAVGPTSAEYWALDRARNKTFRRQERLMAFVKRNTRRK